MGSTAPNVSSHTCSCQYHSSSHVVNHFFNRSHTGSTRNTSGTSSLPGSSVNHLCNRSCTHTGSTRNTSGTCTHTGSTRNISGTSSLPGSSCTSTQFSQELIKNDKKDSESLYSYDTHICNFHKG